MGIEEFKVMIIGKLQDFYGKDADVSITPILKNNGESYEGASTALLK